VSRGFLPRQDVQFTNPTGRPTTAFYTWLQGLDAALQGGTTVEQLQADLARLRAEVAEISTSGFLPVSTSVEGRNSVQVTGTLSGGIVLVQLQGDVVTPAPTRYYGTDATGKRGFHPHALATLSDVDLTGASNGDALVFDGTQWVPEPVSATGFLPLTTGEIAGDQPVFVYGPDGRLIYAPVT
jgi:hypothetical protein